MLGVSVERDHGVAGPGEMRRGDTAHDSGACNQYSLSHAPSSASSPLGAARGAEPGPAPEGGQPQLVPTWILKGSMKCRRPAAPLDASDDLAYGQRCDASTPEAHTGEDRGGWEHHVEAGDGDIANSQSVRPRSADGPPRRWHPTRTRWRGAGHVEGEALNDPLPRSIPEIGA